MKTKTAFFIIFVFIFSFFDSHKIYAYGGGGGLPNGFPSIFRFKIECIDTTYYLPFNKSITVPRCKLITVKPPDNNLNSRLDDFYNRVQHGNK
jgi:hypothetical protein